MRTLRATLICGVLAASLAGFLWTLGVVTPLTRMVFGPGVASAPLSFFGQWTGILLLAFGLAWTTVDICAVPLKITVAAVALAETILLAWFLYLCGVIWPPFTALAAGLFAVGFGGIYGLSKPGRRKRDIEEAFGGRISRATFCQLLDSDEPVAFAGEVRVATVVVCQLFNRQELALTLTAFNFMALSNGFLQTGSQALIDAGGVLTECGEGRFSAVFGTPLAVPGHSAQACRAAFALAHRLEAFRRETTERWSADPDYRIAVHSGVLIAGLCAASLQQGQGGGFTIAGQALDFCRWLCKANLTYGTRLLLGSQTLPSARGAVEARPADLIWNPNGPWWEEIYEGLALAGDISSEERKRCEMFWIGVILYRSKRWDEAATHFEAILKESDDPLARFYLKRMEAAKESKR